MCPIVMESVRDSQTLAPGRRELCKMDMDRRYEVPLRLWLVSVIDFWYDQSLDETMGDSVFGGFVPLLSMRGCINSSD